MKNKGDNTYEVQVFTGLAEKKAFHAVFQIFLVHVVNCGETTSENASKCEMPRTREHVHQVFKGRTHLTLVYLLMLSNISFPTCR